MFFRLLFFAILFFASVPRFASAEDSGAAPRRIPFPIPGRADEAGWETKPEEDEDTEEVLTVPHLLDAPIQQTAARDDGYVPKMSRSTAPEVPSDLRPRYRSVHPESAPRTVPVQRLAPKKPEPEGNDPFVNQMPPVPDLPGMEHNTNDNGVAAENAVSLVSAISPEKTFGQSTPRGPYTVNNVSDETADETSCLPSNSCGPNGGYKTQEEFFFDGWFNGGVFNNSDLHSKGNNAPLFFNDQNGEAVLNQFYLSFGRNVDRRQSRFGAGGRIDLLYGTDYFYTSSLGLETKQTEYIFGQPTLDPLEAVPHWNSGKGVRRLGTASLYGLSMPQAYSEVYLPAGQGITLKAGHFYSGMGLESAMPVQNFFYSHSYSFMYGNPVTLTGGTATVQLNPQTSAMVGITQGWNIFDKPRNGISGIAGLEVKSPDRQSTLSFIVHSGEESLRNGDNRTSYVLTYNRQLASNWSYALEHVYGYEKNGALLNSWTGQRGDAHWTSIAQYLQWKWCDTLTFGARFEWFRDSGQSRIQKSPVSDPGYRELTGKDYYALTLGANWNPVHYITIRPEVRYDWSNIRINGREGVYSNNTKQSMVCFGIDGIIRF